MLNYNSNNKGNQMILDHIQLAKALSKKFQNLSYEDRFQEACLGLVKACHNYKPNKNVSFGSYAKAVILNQLLQYYKKEKMRLVFVVQDSERKNMRKYEQNLSDDSAQNYFELKQDLRKQFGSTKVEILIRIANGRTQRECSQEFGVSQPTVSRMIKRIRELLEESQNET